VESISVTFDRTTNSMTRMSGSWDDEANGPLFRADQTIQVQGNTLNATEAERYYAIDSVSADGLTLFFKDTGTTFAKEVLSVVEDREGVVAINVSAIVNDPTGASLPVIADISGNTITWQSGDYDFEGTAQGSFEDTQGFAVGDLILLSTTPKQTPQHRLRP
jgi:hypothetical protein